MDRNECAVCDWKNRYGHQLAWSVQTGSIDMVTSWDGPYRMEVSIWSPVGMVRTETMLGYVVWTDMAITVYQYTCTQCLLWVSNCCPEYAQIMSKHVAPMHYVVYASGVWPVWFLHYFPKYALVILFKHTAYWQTACVICDSSHYVSPCVT